MSSPQKSVAITGGASGFGKAMALRFAKAGWNVAIADINNERGEETLTKLKALTQNAFYQNVDVRKISDIEQWRDEILKHWGKLDVVINNAGVASHGGIAESPLTDWDWVIDINLMGVVRGCKVFSELFKQQGFGHVVNIASMAGLIHSAEMGSYNASKAAVVALSETMRFELGPYGVGVTVVCPGFFQTNLAESTRSPDAHAQAFMGKMLATSDITADDIADQVFSAVKSNQFMLLPHKSYRHTWYWKRYLPKLYNNKMGKIGAKLASSRQRSKESTGVTT
jgi:NAD(P)-dependent dehydrogenase (short-subunit alcohol dehydrogenase family)